MREPFAEQKLPYAQRAAPFRIKLGRLKGRKHEGLGQGIDPNRVESRQIFRQPPHAPSHSCHLGGRGKPEAFQRNNQFHGRQFRHRVTHEELLQ
jgi:hypothetical protein